MKAQILIATLCGVPIGYNTTHDVTNPRPIAMQMVYRAATYISDATKPFEKEVVDVFKEV